MGDDVADAGYGFVGVRAEACVVNSVNPALKCGVNASRKLGFSPRDQHNHYPACIQKGYFSGSSRKTENILAKCVNCCFNATDD